MRKFVCDILRRCESVYEMRGGVYELGQVKNDTNFYVNPFSLLFFFGISLARSFTSNVTLLHME